MNLKLTLLLVIAIAEISSGANRYWIAAAANWNNPTNWSTSSGGTGGASVPSSGDYALFNSNGLGDCTIDAAVNVKGIKLNSTYTSTLSQGNFSLTIGSYDLTIAGGTFLGGSLSR